MIQGLLTFAGLGRRWRFRVLARADDFLETAHCAGPRRGRLRRRQACTPSLKSMDARYPALICCLAGLRTRQRPLRLPPLPNFPGQTSRCSTAYETRSADVAQSDGSLS